MHIRILSWLICFACARFVVAQVGVAVPVADMASALGGVYAGFEVCADCEAIAVRLTLLSAGDPSQGTFRMKRLYVGAPKRTAAGARVSSGYTMTGQWTYRATDALHGRLCLVSAERSGTAKDCFQVLQGRELRPMPDAGFPAPPVNPVLVKMQRCRDGKEYPLLAYATKP